MTVIDQIYQGDKPQDPAGHPRILALANQKGGVGKTTTAINLGTALAAIGERVLIVDLDPQGNASTGLGIDRRNRSCSTYDVLIGEAPLRDAVVATAVPRLHIAASTMDLSGLELELGATRDRAFRLRDAIAALNTNAATDTDYTYVLIDCPPSLNLLTVNAMAASDAILVPLQCEFFALEGLSQLLQTVEQVRSTLNPNLSIHGIVLTMFDSRNNLSNQVVADVRQFMGVQGLQHHDPAQRAHLRGAVLRQAGAGVRPQMRRQRSLSQARDRSDPARARAAHALKKRGVGKAKRRATRRSARLRQDPGAARWPPLPTLRSNEPQDSNSGVLRVNPRELAMADEARSRLGRGLASLIGDVGGEAAHVERPRTQRKVPIEYPQSQSAQSAPRLFRCRTRASFRNRSSSTA